MTKRNMREKIETCPVCSRELEWEPCVACDGNGHGVYFIERPIGDGGNYWLHGPTCVVCDGTGGWQICPYKIARRGGSPSTCRCGCDSWEIIPLPQQLDLFISTKTDSPPHPVSIHSLLGEG